MRSVICIMAGFACLAMVSPAQNPDAKPFTFEVASIKVNSDIANTDMSMNDEPGGRLNCKNVTLRLLITYAYDIRDSQLLGAPSWAGTERYNILAKPSAGEAANEPRPYSEAENQRMRQRTQALLADRFGLKLHEEKKEMAVYSLVVAKGGPKLQASNSPFPQISANNTRVQCKKVTMQRFAQVLLADRMNRYVIDNTGLTGEYDFTIHFKPDGAPSKEPAGTAPAPTGPSFLTALEEQLGLKLVGAKVPVPCLVVDRVEKASEN
ncbi:MAG TPA: TIGR03435 family protein [Verrucomicrobiae bacterium]|nr:TIGR03435 family protein [Verrucomicrobiae bacterium]